METRVDISEVLRRLEKLEGRFPKNARFATAEGHVHGTKGVAGGGGGSGHGQLHAMSSAADHSGAITSAQHGTFTAGDLHTDHTALLGRAGSTNDTILSTTTGGILSGSSAASQNLTLRSTSDVTKGVIILDSLLRMAVSPNHQIQDSGGTARAQFATSSVHVTLGSMAS